MGHGGSLAQQGSVMGSQSFTPNLFREAKPSHLSLTHSEASERDSLKVDSLYFFDMALPFSAMLRGLTALRLRGVSPLS